VVESNLPDTAPPLLQANLPGLQTQINAIEQNLNGINQSSVKIAAEVREMHKLYHNYYAGTLRTLQSELGKYRNIENERAFDGILEEIASIYSNYEHILDIVKEIDNPKLRKNVTYLFEELVQILEARNINRYKSELGKKRNARYCQVVDRKETQDESLRDTVFESQNSGFYNGNRALIKERVVVYSFSETTADGSAEI
jgi:hypothetical protein